MERVIGRKREIEELKAAYDCVEAQLVAVYGRRRVGKTFLVRKVFEGKFLFRYTGAYKATRQEQLKLFHRALTEQGAQPTPVPKNWWEAFAQLKKFLDDSKVKKKVVFIDEMPWMDSPRSGFVQAFEHFWNSWGSACRHLTFIICGSASSWIINKIFRNRGGLHNRVTKRLHLRPFSLCEVEEYSKHRKLNFSRNELLEGYMVMGGVPFYWSKLQPGKSMARNINDLFLSDGGELRHEFRELYDSIYSQPERYIGVIEALSKKKKGLTREEISNAAKIENNGHLTKVLEDLAESGFIRKYCHLDKVVKDALYQIVDCYTLFYYQFVTKAHGIDENYWLKIQNTPTYHTWCGLAFEKVGLLHTRQIKEGLGISGVLANIFSWHIKKSEDHPGVQIDLLIERADKVINVCEFKYAPGGFHITRQTADNINTKCSVLQLHLPNYYAIRPVLITSNGTTGSRNHFSHIEELTAEVFFLR